MDNININISGPSITGPTGPQGPQGAPPKGQGDTIAPGEIPPETVVPTNSNTPALTKPNMTLVLEPPPPSAPPDAATQEAQLREALETNPELAELFDLILNKRGANTPEGQKELREKILRYLAQQGGGNVERGAREALASELQGIINTSSPEEARELQNVLNKVRLSLLSDEFPETEVLVKLLENKFLEEGKSPEEARQLAEEQALKLIDDHLSSNGVDTPVFASHPLNGAAIQAALFAALPDTFDATEKNAFIAGLGTVLGMEKTLYSLFDDINNITPTDSTTTKNLQNNITTANNALTSLEDLIDTLSQDIETLPLDADQKMQLKEYLKFLSEVIRTLKELLNEISIKDAQRSKELSRSQAKQAETRLELENKRFEAQMKQMEKSEKIGMWIKIAGYVIGAILTVIGALLLPFTGGASLALAIVVMGLIFAATVVLSETGAMTTAFEAIFASIETGNEILDGVIKVVLIVAVVAVLILITRGAGASAAMGPLTSALTVQATMALTTQIIVSSGVIEEIVNLTFGQIPGISDEALMWITVVATVIVMVAVTLAGASALKNCYAKAKAPSETVLRLQRLAPKLQAFGMLMGAAPQVAQAALNIQLAQIKEDIAEYDALIEVINELIKLLEKTIAMLQGDAEAGLEQAAELTELFENAVSGLQDAIGNLSDAQTQQQAA